MASTTPRIDGLERNLIINGNFDFWQRGTSFTSATLPTTNCPVDRFTTEFSGSQTWSVAQIADVPTLAQSGFNSQFSCKFTVTGAGSSGSANYFSFEHRLEGYDYQAIHGRPVRLQFWVKASVTGNYTLTFRNAGINRAYITTYNVAVANTWQKIVVDLTLDSAGSWLFTNGVGLSIYWGLSTGSNYQTSTLNSWQTVSALFGATGAVDFLNNAGATWQIAQVMLIPQNFATAGSSTVDVPFQRAGRSIAHELQMCQRYYEKSYDVDTAPGSNNSLGLCSGATIAGLTTRISMINSVFKVAKRAAPTTVIYSEDGTAGSVSDYSNSATKIASAPNTPGNTNLGKFLSGTGYSGSLYYVFHFTADSEL